MALIKYVGLNPKKQDNVAGTNLWWFGAGDVREVPETAVGKLLSHPDVWAPAEVAEGAGLGAVAQPPAPPAPPPSPETPPRFALDGPAGVVVLDAMDDAAVKAWVAENLEPHGIKVDGRKKGDSLKQAVIDAVKAATATQD